MVVVIVLGSGQLSMGRRAGRDEMEVELEVEMARHFAGPGPRFVNGGFSTLIP